MVFGLLRVVGSLLVQQLPPGIPLQSCVNACIALNARWVSCVAYLIDGIIQRIDVHFRLVSHVRCEMNLEAAFLFHSFDAHTLILWPIEGCLVSWIWNLVWA